MNDLGRHLRGRYDDDRSISIEPSVNNEVGVWVGNQEPVWLDALDLLRLVSDIVLNMVYGPSPTGDYRPIDRPDKPAEPGGGPE